MSLESSILLSETFESKSRVRDRETPFDCLIIEIAPGKWTDPNLTEDFVE